MKLLLELNGWKTRIFPCVVAISRACKGIECQQIRRWFIGMNKRRIVDRPATLLEWGLQRDIVLRSKCQNLIEIKFINGTRR